MRSRHGIFDTKLATTYVLLLSSTKINYHETASQMDMSPGSYYWGYRPGTLPWSQVHTTHLKIGHLLVKSWFEDRAPV